LHTVSQRGFQKAESNQVDIQILRGACPWLHDYVNGWIALEANPLSKKRGVAGAEGSDILTFFALFSAVRPSNLWRNFQKKLILQQSRITRLLQAFISKLTSSFLRQGVLLVNSFRGALTGFQR
jgi:hypothetical protein